MRQKICQGWRYFKCRNCGCDWRQTSRDCYTPSGESCLDCDDWVTPVYALPDELISVDKNTGNLIGEMIVEKYIGIPRTRSNMYIVVIPDQLMTDKIRWMSNFVGRIDGEESIILKNRKGSEIGDVGIHIFMKQLTKNATNEQLSE